jgi:hypothetical protein
MNTGLWISTIALLIIYLLLFVLLECSVENSYFEIIGGGDVCSNLDDGVGNLALLTLFSSLFYLFVIK